MEKSRFQEQREELQRQQQQQQQQQEAAEKSKIRSRERTLAKRTQITLDNLFAQIEAGNIKEQNIIIKADTQDSVDVLTKYLSVLSTDEAKNKILHAAVGGITEGDCLLAEASDAIIIGFNVVTEEHVSKLAEVKGVDIRLYTLYYRTIEDMRKSMAGLIRMSGKEVDKQLLLRVYVSKFAEKGELIEGIVNLYRAVNKYHIARGGTGLTIDDWQILVQEQAPAGVVE